MIAAPLPGSRSTSRITFAPLVIACSACVRWVLGSPCALTIVWVTPAAVSALSRYGRSNCSHRTDDCVSGSSTATSALLPPAVDDVVDAAPPVLLGVLLLLLEPQPAITRAANPIPRIAFSLYFLILRSSIVVVPLSFQRSDCHHQVAP